MIKYYNILNVFNNNLFVEKCFCKTLVGTYQFEFVRIYILYLFYFLGGRGD